MKKDWTYKKLGEVLVVERGGSPRPIQAYLTTDPNGLNWIKIGDAVEGSKYITSTKEKIKPEGLHKTRFVNKGDFILSNSMSFGRPYILDIDGCIHDGWLVLRDKENVFDKSFLYYYLSSPNVYNEFKRLAVGGVVNNLNSELVRGVTLPIPPISIQESIVRELDAIHGILEKKQEQLRELDNLAQAIFYDMFGDPITNPKQWEVKKLGEIFEISSGGTPSKNIKDYWENGNIPWIGSNMCQNAVVYETDGKFITKKGLEKSSAKLLPIDSVLVALVGATIGKVALLKTESSTNQNIAFIKPHKDYNPTYVFYHLMNQYDLFMNIGNGDFKMATQGFIKSLSLMLAPLSLQQSFAAKIEAIEAQKQAVQQSIREIEALLAERMDNYFG